MILNQYCVPSQDTVLFIFSRRFQFMILNHYCIVFHLRILCYLYLKAFSIHDFKSVLCSISGYYVIYIYRRFQFMILNQYCVPPQDTRLFIFFRRFQFLILNQCCLFHLRILCYLYFLGVFNS